MGPGGVSAVFIAVGTEHPEGGPNAGSFGEFDVSGNLTVAESLFLGGVETGRSVLVETMLVGFVNGFNDELPVLDVCVFFVVGVALPLLIEASGWFDLAVPVGRVEIGCVEFFRPDEFPVLGGSGHNRSIRN